MSGKTAKNIKPYILNIYLGHGSVDIVMTLHCTVKVHRLIPVSSSDEWNEVSTLGQSFGIVGLNEVRLFIPLK